MTLCLPTEYSRLHDIKKIIISPPFGNYINFDWATSVKGSYTLKRRPGLFKQIIKTLRPIKNGWINQIGLRNPGFKGIKRFDDKCIYSIIAVDFELEWEVLWECMPYYLRVEINLGCPNENCINITSEILSKYKSRFDVIVKIPPTEKADYLIDLAYNSGIRTFHLCNTIPTERGGESGQRLKQFVLPIINRIKNKYDDIKIIGGGGIYSKEDVIDYHMAGVDHFSLSTVWFTPWKVLEIKKQIEKLN